MRLPAGVAEAIALSFSTTFFSTGLTVALGEFGATILFAGNFPGLTQTMPLAIYVGFEVHLDRAVALSVLLLLCSFTALMLARWLLNRALS